MKNIRNIPSCPCFSVHTRPRGTQHKGCVSCVSFALPCAFKLCCWHSKSRQEQSNLHGGIFIRCSSRYNLHWSCAASTDASINTRGFCMDKLTCLLMHGTLLLVHEIWCSPGLDISNSLQELQWSDWVCRDAVLVGRTMLNSMLG